MDFSTPDELVVHLCQNSIAVEERRTTWMKILLSIFCLQAYKFQELNVVSAEV